jgi:hypothetical protein
MDEHSLFQEVDEDLQRKKMEAWWKEHGTKVLAGALLIVLATAGFNGWQAYRTFTEQKVSGAVLALTDDAKLSDEQKADKLQGFARANSGISQATLARFDAAEAEIKDKKVDKAVAIYDALAADGSVETPFRQLADLMAVQATMDTGDSAVLIKRLEPLMAEGGAWAPSAKELGGYLAIKMGDKAKARQLFREASQDPHAPETLVPRAKDMLRWLGEGT